MYELLIEPMQYGFMQRALLVAALAAVACGVVGTFVVLRGMAFLGDAIAHSALTGMAAAFLLGFNVFLGALVWAVPASLGVTAVSRRAGIRIDAVIGVLFAGGFALGIILVDSSENYAGDLLGILFGNVLGASWNDALAVVVLAGGVLATVGIFYKELVFTTYDAQVAEAAGLPVRFLEYLLPLLVALTTVAALKTVGNVMVMSLLVVPAVTGTLLARRLSTMMLATVTVALAAVVGGLYLSFHLNLPTGPAIVVVSVGLLLLALILSPRRRVIMSLLLRRKQRQERQRRAGRDIDNANAVPVPDAGVGIGAGVVSGHRTAAPAAAPVYAGASVNAGASASAGEPVNAGGRAGFADDDYVQLRRPDDIPPIYAPEFVAPEAAGWPDGEPVVGLALNGEARAYPACILYRREVVNDVVGGVPVLVSCCPLCDTALAHERRLDETTPPPVFGNQGALYRGGMTWYDHATGSVWSQPLGAAIAGPAAGRRLALLPAQLTTWGQWRAAYPDTLTLAGAEDTTPAADYQGPGAEHIVGVVIGDDAAAWPYPAVAAADAGSPVTGRVGGVAVSLWRDDESGAIRARRGGGRGVETPVIIAYRRAWADFYGDDLDDAGGR